MIKNPYTNLSSEKFWSAGVASSVNSQCLFNIRPLKVLLEANDGVVSAGSCFAQYIGHELEQREANFLKSQYSADRIESFGLGNIYTTRQWKQWLEFSLGMRAWGDQCVFNGEDSYYDYLLPHLGAYPGAHEIHAHRENVKKEIIDYLSKANVLVFTVGLTEAWVNTVEEVYPCCPGTLVGEFDPTLHSFYNLTFNDILNDLYEIDRLLSEISTGLKVIYTTSPVPLTATASEDHILVANTYSKSVIRAAIGEFCTKSERTDYFPSYEIINHHCKEDQRFQKNLRSISDIGVQYVMKHAFYNVTESDDQEPALKATGKKISTHDIDESQDTESDSIKLETGTKSIEAICEEHLLESHAKLINEKPSSSRIILAGDCHMGLLANGFESNQVEVKGGMIMHGSAFTDFKFEVSNERILLPTEHKKSQDLWFRLHDQILELDGDCDIITNICFHTHRTIVRIANHFNSYVITIDNIAEFFEKFYQPQIYVLSRLTMLGKVWMIEDPAFHAFLNSKDTSIKVRAKNFQQYCNYMRMLAQEFGIEYLNPCDTAIQKAMSDGYGVKDIIEPDSILGTELYYKYCANVVSGTMSSAYELLKKDLAA